MKDLLNRKGTFFLDRETLLNEPETVLKVMSDLIVVHTDENFMKNGITYWAYSSKFDVVKPDEKVPAYQAIVHYDYSDDIAPNITVSWEKVEE